MPIQCSKELFRWDLFYRLSTVELKLSSLLERGEKEIKTLIDHFIKIKRKPFGREKKLEIDKAAIQSMIEYNWPGNVRELENVIESMYVFNEQFADKNSLPERLFESADNRPLQWEFIEKEHIKKVLRIYKGNQNKVAEAIGYAINTLRTKFKGYNLNPEDYK